jgi:hypothetical protein
MWPSKGQFSGEWFDFEAIYDRRHIEGKTGSIHRRMDSWRCRKGINALFRRKHKGKDGIGSQALPEEEVGRAGAIEQAK